MIVFYFSLLIFSIDLNPLEVQRLIQTGLKFAYVEEFDSASFYFEQVIEKYPHNPAGYFFKSALLQLKMMDGCHFNDEKEYLSLVKKVRKLCAEILEKETNLWAEFYLGSSYAYQAVYEGLKKNYLETFNYGVKGGKILQSIIKKDSLFYDAYLGAGTYEYFWARASRYLPFLKLADGDVNEAIGKLHVAAERSMYSGPTARNSLVFIYGEEKRFEIATKIIDSLLLEYPNSKTFHWNKAELEFKKKNYNEALKIYEWLFNQYLDNPNYSNLAQCKLYIGKCYYELKNRDEAKKILKEVLGYKKYQNQYPLIKEYCREAYELLSKILY
ncbi:MAG: tetratricopeptide repeat protein [candidate division WOR-3 bacterium]|nr:tetratricopeptide repeat protein [candidate division WOR-3 bacterium]